MHRQRVEIEAENTHISTAAHTQFSFAATGSATTPDSSYGQMAGGSDGGQF